VVTMVCKTWILASCNSEERRLVLGAEAMRFRTRVGTTAVERFWGWRSYQTMRSAEAIMVAKRTILRRSSCAVIARQSSSCGQRDLVVDGSIDLERKKKQDHVWEVRRHSGKRKTPEERWGEGGTHRTRRFLPAAEEARRGSICAA
jgi:hypothetical protein